MYLATSGYLFRLVRGGYVALYKVGTSGNKTFKDVVVQPQVRYRICLSTSAKALEWFMAGYHRHILLESTRGEQSRCEERSDLEIASDINRTPLLGIVYFRGRLLSHTSSSSPPSSSAPLLPTCATWPPRKWSPFQSSSSALETYAVLRWLRASSKTWPRSIL